jgi:hypothetical protein
MQKGFGSLFLIVGVVLVILGLVLIYHNYQSSDRIVYIPTNPPVASANPSLPPNLIPGWQVYGDQAGIFQLEYPQGWVYQSLGGIGGGGGAILSEEANSQAKGNGNSPSFPGYSWLYLRTFPNDQSKNNQSWAKFFSEDSSVISQENIKINGLDTIKLITSKSGLPSTTYFVDSPKKDQTLVVSIHNEEGTPTSKDQKIFDQIISTIQANK